MRFFPSSFLLAVVALMLLAEFGTVTEALTEKSLRGASASTKVRANEQACCLAHFFVHKNTKLTQPLNFVFFREMQRWTSLSMLVNKARAALCPSIRVSVAFGVFPSLRALL